VKAIDSNILVYASLSDHPASAASEAYIAGHVEWLCSVSNLVEMRQVLVSVYGLSESDADTKFEDFRAALEVYPLSDNIVVAALSLRRIHRIDLNDAVLLESAIRRGVSVICTDDRGLARACEAVGIAPESPINEALREQMSQWEESNIPSKGLPRVLLQVHRWIQARNPAMACEFQSATQALSRMV